MKTPTLVLTLALLTACSSPSYDANAPATATTPETRAESAPAESMSMPETAPAAATASAYGTVEAVDATARTITIAHGPVDTLKWPAMTMVFKATPEQIASVKAGQKVVFEFESKGMEATITKINGN